MNRIKQCVISYYTGPRTFDAREVPNGYPIKNVRLPNTITMQTKPLEKSVVFVVEIDDYQTYFLSVVRDPIGFLEKSNIGVQGSVDDPTQDRSSAQFDTGEIYLESRGESTDISGGGATLYLSNDGTVNIHSGRRKESIILGGTDDEDDGEVVITADNGFFESNVNDSTNTQSTVRFDEDNQIEIGNFRVTIPQSGVFEDISELPIVNIIMEPDGDLTLANYNLFGVERNKLNMDTSGLTSVEATNIEFTAINSVSLEANTSITAEANVINLNNGVEGAARLNDEILIDTSTDATYLSYLQALDSFMSTVFTLFNAHVHTSAAPGNPTTPPLTPILITPPTSPSTITGKINEGSDSVVIGD